QRLLVVFHRTLQRNTDDTTGEADRTRDLRIVPRNRRSIEHGPALQRERSRSVGSALTTLIAQIVADLIELRRDEIIDLSLGCARSVQIRRISAEVVQLLFGDERHASMALHEL